MDHLTNVTCGLVLRSAPNQIHLALTFFAFASEVSFLSEAGPCRLVTFTNILSTLNTCIALLQCFVQIKISTTVGFFDVCQMRSVYFVSGVANKGLSLWLKPLLIGHSTCWADGLSHQPGFSLEGGFSAPLG